MAFKGKAGFLGSVSVSFQNYHGNVEECNRVDLQKQDVFVNINLHNSLLGDLPLPFA